MRSLIVEDDPEAIELGPNAISLDLLQAVYRSTSLPLSLRMRAAGMAIQFECAKLAVSYQASEQDFAVLLDQRIARLQQAKTIEAAPIKENGGNADARLAPPIPDRRFRRI